MSIFAGKAAFMQLGLEQVAPTNGLIYQDCYICKHPLDVNIHAATSEEHHSAVRIGVCSHMYGKECLAAWLDTGNSCPICRRMLFKASSHSLQQSDINSVARSLGRYVGKARIMSAIARLVGKQELESARLRRDHEKEAREAQVKEAQSRQDASLDDGDWYPSSGEEDFDANDEDLVMDGDDLSEGDEDLSMNEADLSMDEDDEDDDSAVVLDEEDAESESTTA